MWFPLIFLPIWYVVYSTPVHYYFVVYLLLHFRCVGVIVIEQFKCKVQFHFFYIIMVPIRLQKNNQKR